MSARQLAFAQVSPADVALALKIQFLKYLQKKVITTAIL